MTSDLEAELLAVRLWLGLASSLDIGDWLDAYVARVPDPHPDVLELFSFDSEQLVAAFLAHVRAEWGLERGSERVPQLATKLLAQLCQSVLNGTLSVPKFCQIVSHIDANYVESGLGLPYPKGLSALWNGCDWCDDEWSLETAPHLRELLEKHIAAAEDDVKAF